MVYDELIFNFKEPQGQIIFSLNFKIQKNCQVSFGFLAFMTLPQLSVGYILHRDKATLRKQLLENDKNIMSLTRQSLSHGHLIGAKHQPQTKQRTGAMQFPMIQ